MLERLVQFLCACSGIRKDALDAVPSGRTLAINQGALLLLVATFAAASGWQAWYRIRTDHPLVAVESCVAGGLWGTLVFFIDRSLAMSLDKSSRWSLVKAIAIRLPLAAIIAVTLSTPVVLSVSEPVLNRDLRVTERREVASEALENATAADLGSRRVHMEAVDRQLHELEKQLKKEPDTDAYRQAKAASIRAEQAYGAVAAANGRRIAYGTSDLAALAALESNPPERARASALRASLSEWQRDIDARAAVRDAARRALAGVEANWAAKGQAKQQELADTLAETRRLERQARQTLNEQDAESARVWSSLMRPSLINQYSALRRIAADPRHPDSSALRRWEWGLHLLFFFVETAVLLVKALLPTGPLDTAILSLNALDEERVTVRANAAMVRLQALGASRAALEADAMKIYLKQHTKQCRTNPREIPEQLEQIRREWEDMTPAG